MSEEYTVPALMPNELKEECAKLISALSEAQKEIVATALRGAALGKVGWDIPELYSDEMLFADTDHTFADLLKQFNAATAACTDAPLKGVERKKVLDLIVYLIFALIRTRA